MIRSRTPAQHRAMDTLQRRSSSSPRSSSSSFSLEPCKSVKEEARSLKAAVKKLDDGAGKEAGASGDGETEMRMRRQLFRDHIQHRGLTTRPKTAQQEAKDKATVETWREEQGMVSGPVIVDSNDTAAIHLNRIDFYNQIVFLAKDRAAQTGSTFSDAGFLPNWIKLGLTIVRPIVEHYEVDKASLNPYQRYILGRARSAIKELEDMWCEDLEKAWMEDEVDEESEGEEEDDMNVVE